MRRSLLIGLISVLLMGCSAIPTPTPTVTPVPPTATPEPPTSTPAPTATPEPTATAEPTATPDPAMKLWYTPNGNLLVQTASRLLLFDGTDYHLIWQVNNCCEPLAVSDTRIVIANGNALFGLDGANGEEAFRVQAGNEPTETQTFFSAAVSPDGQTVATGEDEQIRLWNATTGEQLAVWSTGDEGFEDHPGTAKVTNVAFRPDGLVLYSANSFSGNVFSWAIGSYNRLSAFELVNIIRYTFTPDTRSIIAETIDYGFKAYDPRTGILQGEHPAIISAAGYLSFTADGQQVVAWGYDTEEGHVAGLWEVATDTLLHSFITPLDQPAWRSAAITPGGTVIALIDETGEEVFFYNASTGEQVNTLAMP